MIVYALSREVMRLAPLRAQLYFTYPTRKGHHAPQVFLASRTRPHPLGAGHHHDDLRSHRPSGRPPAAVEYPAVGGRPCEQHPMRARWSVRRDPVHHDQPEQDPQDSGDPDVGHHHPWGGELPVLLRQGGSGNRRRHDGQWPYPDQTPADLALDVCCPARGDGREDALYRRHRRYADVRRLEASVQQTPAEVLLRHGGIRPVFIGSPHLLPGGPALLLHAVARTTKPPRGSSESARGHTLNRFRFRPQKGRRDEAVFSYLFTIHHSSILGLEMFVGGGED